MRLALILVGACGAAAPTTIANRQASAPLHCDAATVDHLRGVLSHRWHVKDLELGCAAGSFGAPGYFIAATASPLRRIGIVDPSGAELVPFVEEPLPAIGVALNGYQAADLDGDGEDEIVESWRKTSPFAVHNDSWLVVRIVSNHRLRTIKGPFLSRYHPDLGGCSSTWALRPGGIRIATAVTPGIPPTDCLQAGTHDFALRGHALVDSQQRR
jgi:hypothetical protein